ncbi:hypothetical protein BJ878DRAFT_460084 [Calycina marina]|uniref:F-box domain-containing protein n=1 Tax=Calycina marina TaxID=1763456 RepID=A0A9P7Z3C3_9HELO|nr:hypothetical protein BJ878DRAFT_460084 [Calycina marina]
MALDAQSNWNAEMSQPLKLAHRPRARSPTSAPTWTSAPPSKEISLPAEIIIQILSYITELPLPQHALHSCALISHIWYSVTIPHLYARPRITGTNYDPFIRTICPSKNAYVRHSPLAALVLRLDMSRLVHNSSRSLTARLLGRLKPNLEEFIAPQASFAVNSFAALSKCTKLRELDLSLISASISNKQLFQTLAPLEKLETLFFPRTSTGLRGRQEEEYKWPPNLRVLHLAGGIDDYFLLHQLVNCPPSLSQLSIQHCASVFAPALLETLSTIGPQLRQFTIRHGMSKLQTGVLDILLILCPKLEALRIDADYISNGMFECIPQNHPLRILDLDCSPQTGADVEINPRVLYEVVENDMLPDLRRVVVSARLAWSATEKTRRDVGDLVEVLEDAEMERPLGQKAGVFVMKDW